MEGCLDEAISAFAFKVAEDIECVIKEKVGATLDENRYLSAKLLGWYFKTKDKEFADYFGLKIDSGGYLDLNKNIIK
jgi:hypothetical protein